MIKRFILCVVLLLFVGLLIVGCESTDEQEVLDPDAYVCENDSDIGKQYYYGSQWCTCTEEGWKCESPSQIDLPEDDSVVCENRDDIGKETYGGTKWCNCTENGWECEAYLE